MSASAASPTDQAGDSPPAANSLAHGVVLLLTLTIVQRLVGFLRSVLICRWLPTEQLGQWDLSFGFLMLAAPLAVLGLPGSFGRYVEHYRQQGQLKTLLRRTTLCTVLLSLAGMLVVILGRRWLSPLIFGGDDQVPLVLVLGISLGLVVSYNFLVSLTTALRQYRVVSAMQFLNSVLFAAGSIVLVLFWKARTESVVIAFAAACLGSSLLAIGGLRKTWNALPGVQDYVPHRTMWSKLLPFAFWLWMTNWLSNFFEITDRFMIVHYSGLGPDDALNLVGQYHSARVLPILIIGVADLLATIITPHLSCDWEAGRRQLVSERLNLVVKLFAFLLVAASACVLIGAPLLFGVALKEKYSVGLAVLPWTLAACVWTGMASITYNYLWCAEKSRWVSLTLAIGLVLNVGLDYTLLPTFGLLGAVMSSAAAKLVSLGVLWAVTRKLGFQTSRGLLLAAALPLLLILGPAVALTLLAALALGVIQRSRMFTPAEQLQITAGLRSYMSRWPLTARLAARWIPEPSLS